ncbi:MAG TPA: iron ABC transporter permease [Chloroflexia bacterium]|nr:iron ABC transporter permease [Chloroflexia bacterium]
MTGIVLLLVTLIVCVTFGSVSVRLDSTFKIIWNHTIGQFISLPADYTSSTDTIIWQIRLPRLVLGACVGAGLSGAGAIYQGLFRNPLADPYLVGVAQGAAVGAVVAIVLPLPAFLYNFGIVQWGAFAGAIITVAIVYNLARAGGEVKTGTLLLAGVAIGSLASAITTMLTYLHNDKLTTIYGWLLGGFNAVGSWDNIMVVVPYLAMGFFASAFFGRKLNVLQMGEEQAAQLGVNVGLIKLLLVVIATLMAAAAVSVSGIIGFVGLVVPHLVRMLAGQDYRLLLPLSIVWGAIFMVLADSLARTLLAPSEIPVSIITAFCGGPFFIYILKRKKKPML